MVHFAQKNAIFKGVKPDIEKIHIINNENYLTRFVVNHLLFHMIVVYI